MMCSHDTFRSLGSAAPLPGPDGCQNGLSQSAAMHLERMNTNDGSRNNKTNTLSTTMNMTWEQNSHLSMWMIDSFPERSTNVHMWLVHCTSPANSPIAPACWQIFRTHTVADDWSSTLLKAKRKTKRLGQKIKLGRRVEKGRLSALKENKTVSLPSVENTMTETKRENVCCKHYTWHASQ